MAGSEGIPVSFCSLLLLNVNLYSFILYGKWGDVT